MKSEAKIKAIFVIGPTATGKTGLGVDIARRVGGEIISIDSRQVYRGLDLGTGKDLIEFGEGKSAIPYHLIDVAEPTEDYNLHRFIRDAKVALEDIVSRGKTPIFVGGTTLYTNALLNGYELIGCQPNKDLRNELGQKTNAELLEELKKYPAQYEKCDRDNRKRLIRALEIVLTPVEETSSAAQLPKFEPLLMGPYFHRSVVHKRIHKRLTERIEEGMIEEVQGLLNKGVSWEKLDWFGLEYRWVAKFLKGELTKEVMTEKLFMRIRKFCKQQDIWLRKLEREGKVIHWLADGNRQKAYNLVDLFLESKPLPEPEFKISEIYYGPKSQ